MLQGYTLQKKFDNVKWKYDDKMMEAWKRGETGFPIIDAAMRELNTTGFMHNRCRMTVASFLSKDLFLDWQEGERYFATKLVDYSPMQNSGGWQWIVQPFDRIFNPWIQQQNYDEDCVYIKKWLPELEEVPAADIHKWNETCSYYLKRGVNYRAPMIDHNVARKEALQRFDNCFQKRYK